MEFDFFSKKYFVTRFFSYMQYETKAYNFLKLRDAGDYVKDFLKVKSQFSSKSAFLYSSSI